MVSIHPAWGANSPLLCQFARPVVNFIFFNKTARPLWDQRQSTRLDWYIPYSKATMCRTWWENVYNSNVTSSVPQGTVVRLLCFLIYINNMTDCISSGTKMHLFADKALIYCEINTVDDTKIFQKDLDTLSKWGADWQMAFNTDKCFTMHFTSKKSPSITPYQLCGNTLQVTSSHPYLDINFGSDLKWNSHMTNVTKSSKKIWESSIETSRPVPQTLNLDST